MKGRLTRWGDLLRDYVRFRFYARYRPGRFPHVNLSFSQFGEDMVLSALLGDDPARFYVDIGAHHPVMASNTYHFYLRGWTGLNVDAMPGSMDLFRWLRPRDGNVEAAVGPVGGAPMQLFVFDQPALNTLDPARAEEVQAGGARVRRVVPVRCVTITELLERHLPRGREVSFLNLDTEAMDAVLLATIDWARFRPRAVVFEALGVEGEALPAHPSVQLLAAHGYRVAARTGPTVIAIRP